MTVKPELTPPPGPPPSWRPGGRPGLRALSLGLVALLLAGAVLVVLVLPAELERRSATPEGGARAGSASTERRPAPAPPDGAPADTRQAPEAARAAQRQALEAQARLENAGVRVWGEEKLETRYPEARAAMAQAHAHFEGRRYREAAAAYGEVLALLGTLDASRPRRLEMALERGQQALATEAAQSAVRDFEVVLALDPGNQLAAEGLERAHKRPDALRALETGRAHEASGDLPAAREAFAAALALDPGFGQARAAAERVEARIRAGELEDALAQASTALGQERLDAAGKALRRARAIDPASSRVAGLEGRLATARRDAEVARLRRQGAELEQAGRWAEAAEAYRAALAIDGSLAFAIDGERRTSELAALHRELDAYLSRPERLYSADPRRQARSILDAARRIGDPGPRLAEKRDRLARLIAAAETPVEVVLRSDGLTEVTLLRVGRLGTFAEQRLMLTPGAYVAMGSRNGYRDVRVTIDVEPLARSISVVVKCEEAI